MNTKFSSTTNIIFHGAVSRNDIGMIMFYFINKQINNLEPKIWRPHYNIY